MNKLTTLAIIGLLSLVTVITGCASKAPSSTGIAQSTLKSGLSENSRQDYLNAINELEGKDYQRASSNLQRVMAGNPGFVEGWGNLALAQLHLGEIQTAKQSLDNALQLDQESAMLQNLAGLIAIEEGMYEIAEKYYMRAISLNPSMANAHYNLALLHDIYYQDIGKAIQHYERYLSLINNADTDTEAWVQELKRNLK